MKASEILNDTLKMLGYAESNGNVELPQRIRNRAIVAINLVYEDLCSITTDETFVPIKSLADEIKLPERVQQSTFMYGLAMNISQSENDGDQQQLYARLYNQKRAGLSNTVAVKNTLPQIQ